MKEIEEGEGLRDNIYKVCRKIKRREQSLYNALRSIYHDSQFVSEIRCLWPELPVVANLRCGLWYSTSGSFHSTCYFKSTDGHAGNWSFNPTRLNLHIPSLAVEKGGCMIVDATRKGKRFPDSMSKTIPIWTCILNRAIQRFRADKLHRDVTFQDWDSSLHLPLWVSDTEKANIERRMEEWVQLLADTGTDLSFLATNLLKPLRPLWISQNTIIWLNEVPDFHSWDFTPIILISASSSMEKSGRMSDDDFSWSYIPGAADDEESWARGLTPALFWKHFDDLIHSGPDTCNKLVADIVEKDRVYRSQRGQVASQITVKSAKASSWKDSGQVNRSTDLKSYTKDRGASCTMEGIIELDNIIADLTSEIESDIFWIGTSGLALGTRQHDHLPNSFDQTQSILDCNSSSCFDSCREKDAYFHLPIQSSKFDRSGLQSSLFLAVGFARKKLSQGRKLLIICSDGEDISVCVCLAIFISLFDENGAFDDGRTYQEADITKWDVRRKLVYICSFAPKARPSRGNLKQVYNFLRIKNSHADF